MTKRAMTICNGPGCQVMVTYDVKYCPRHTTDPGSTDDRTEEQRARHRLYDRKWKKRRANQLSKYPWCAACLKRKIFAPATEVHHVVAHRGDRDKFETSPLQSLCKTCHSRITANETPPRRKDSQGDVERMGSQTFETFPDQNLN